MVKTTFQIFRFYNGTIPKYFFNKLRHIWLPVLSIALSHSCLFAQNAKYRDKDESDGPLKYWFMGIENARETLGVTKEDYMVFLRFSEVRLDSLRSRFFSGPGRGKTDSSGIAKKLADMETCLEKFYKQFEKINKEYPSSVEEYRHPFRRLQSVCDTSGCTNIGFEQGNLNGWSVYYGFNNNPYPGMYSFFNLTNITGGPVGAVTHAANDPLTSNPAYYNLGVGPNPSPDYMVNITTGTRGDWLVPSVPVVSPFGGNYSVMLGDSNLVNYGAAILTKTFLVSEANADFTYQYAVFLENPKSHPYYDQPFFTVAVLDQNGDTIPYCGQYNVVSSGANSKGFDSVYVPITDAGVLGGDTAYYKNWTLVCVPLKNYIGQCVTVVFEAADCGWGGHFGYAYVDASCAPLQIITSSPAICGQNYITLTGPPGFVAYNWSSPAGFPIQGNGSQSVQIDNPGTYILVAVPVTGTSCADTLSITVTKSSAPLPAPGFTADTTCIGQPTYFINTSNPDSNSGAKFYWDFYNLGSFEDSTANPAWTFNSPGVYPVKLYEISNGCGADTTINVVVVSSPQASIIAPGTDCAGTPVTLIATGGVKYLWNTGATTNIITVTPVAPDTSFFVLVTNACSTDTAYQSIHIITNIIPVLACCDTTVLSGDSAVLNADGVSSYAWSPSLVACDTCPLTKAAPTVTTIYTVTGTDSNGCVTTDTVTINIVTCAELKLTPVSACCDTTILLVPGDSAILKVSGAVSYVWSPSAVACGTCPDTRVAPTTTTIYTVTGTDSIGCKSTDTVVVKIETCEEFKIKPVNACCDTAIPYGDSAILTARGATSYIWSPSFAGCDTCPYVKVSPTVNTTYTVTGTDSIGCKTTDTLYVKLNRCANTWIPDAFTPNGDGLNDSFFPKGDCILTYLMYVFNRWGSLIYTSNNKPWDGAVNGTIVQEDTYIYELLVTTNDLIQRTYVGKVTVIK
ncbi:MAG: T9SS type B sorting domain-containing protein [Bacteroidia bacterium]